MVQDHVTKFIDGRPTSDRRANDKNMGFVDFAGTDATIGRIYTNGSGEMAAASHGLLLRHAASTPQRPQFNGARRNECCTATTRYAPFTWVRRLASVFPFARNVADENKDNDMPYFPSHTAHFGGGSFHMELLLGTSRRHARVSATSSSFPMCGQMHIRRTSFFT